MTSRRGLILFLVVPGAIALGASLVTSKVCWNYWWWPHTVTIPRELRPLAFSAYQARPDVRVLDAGERTAILDSQIVACTRESECNLGRTLAQFRSQLSSDLPLVPSESIASMLASAAGPQTFYDGTQPGFGMAVLFTDDTCLLGFSSSELRDDTHGYFEAVLSPCTASPRVIQQRWYWFDVAGIEFATPKFLLCFYAVIAYGIAGYAALIIMGLRSRALSSVAGRCKEPRDGLH
jgi:hypothetical protein